MGSKVLSKLKLYVTNLLIATDETANCVIGGAPSDTISGRAMRAKDEGKVLGKIVYPVLDGIQADHCETALANDEAGRHKESF